MVEYLLAKAPGVCKSAVLPFEGKNVVVYSLGGADADASLCRVADVQQNGIPLTKATADRCNTKPATSLA